MNTEQGSLGAILEAGYHRAFALAFLNDALMASCLSIYYLLQVFAK